MSFCYMIGEFVFGQKRFATYLAHRLRSQRHCSAVAIRLENEKTTKEMTRAANGLDGKGVSVTEVVNVNRRCRRCRRRGRQTVKQSTKYEWRENVFKKQARKINFRFLLFILRVRNAFMRA